MNYQYTDLTEKITIYTLYDLRYAYSLLCGVTIGTIKSNRFNFNNYCDLLLYHSNKRISDKVVWALVDLKHCEFEHRREFAKSLRAKTRKYFWELLGDDLVSPEHFDVDTYHIV